MRFISLLCTLALAKGVIGKDHEQLREREDSSKNPEDRRPTGATRKYIIELEHLPKRAELSARYHADLRTDFKKPGSYYSEFNCDDIFSGLSLETENENVDTLRARSGVANVWPMKSVPLAQVVKKDTLDPDVKLTNYSMHQWTGVDKLHAKGVRGKGATVAIIDTGIDYTHKALGGCFGPGCKVVGGYDLVGRDWDTHEERRFPKEPDNNPMDFYGHGTHVAGILAAENDWLTGVAPDAELLIYKVFADDPWDTDEEVLIQSFCDAYSSGADVITASIGRPDGFADNPWALVASRLVEKGVVVTISAGNEGYTGPFYSSSGSNGHDVLSISAVNVTGSRNISTKDPSAAPIPAYFTTWGPTNELLLKPDIAAPGYDVISTVLNQSFEEMSGTSMSAPYIAGVAALFVGEHGGREMHGPDFARMLGRRIISSGRSVAWSTTSPQLNQTAPPFQVGTGLVDAWKVLNYKTQLTFEPFSLLDTELFQPHWTADITNHGNKTVAYNFQVEPQAGVDIYDAYYGVGTLFDMKPKKIVPHVTLPKPLKLRPGESKTVEFVFELPKGVDDDLLPLYGGKIWVKGNNGERLAIPYGGAAYDTEKAFDTMFTSQPYINEYKSDWAWSFNVEKNPFDFIELASRLSYPCFHLRWDIFEEHWRETLWQYPPVVGENRYVGSATTMRDADLYWYYNPNRMDKNDTIAFPMMRVPRGYENSWWFGKLANGSQIAPGNYTMRFAALRPYGNPNISDHWDIMPNEVPSFQVLPYNASNATSFKAKRGPQVSEPVHWS